MANAPACLRGSADSCWVGQAVTVLVEGEIGSLCTCFGAADLSPVKFLGLPDHQLVVLENGL
jgi:hypothetical protein